MLVVCDELHHAALRIWTHRSAGWRDYLKVYTEA